MINLFISMPMRGKTHKEIIKTRYRAIARVKLKFPHEDITVINPLPFTSGERPLPVCCLADSLKRMTTADVIFFAQAWDIARGCRVEHFVACHYMPQILRVYESKQNHRKRSRSNVSPSDTFRNLFHPRRAIRSAMRHLHRLRLRH